MTAPQGTDLVFGYGFEKQDNVWVPSAINKFLPLVTASGMVAKRPLVRTRNMDSSGQTRAGRNVQAQLSPKIGWEPGVDELLPILAHMNGFYSWGAQLGGGTGPWPVTTRPILPTDGAMATYVDSLVMVQSDGDGFPVLVSGNRATDFSYKIDAGKLQMFNVGFVGCFDTYTDDPAQLGAGTWTGKPIIRGHWDPSKTGPVKLKVTAAAGGGFDGTVKLTTAAYAGVTTIQVKFDTWYRVTLDDATRLGIARYEDLWFYLPASGGTLLQVGQEWSFANQRAVPTASYSARNPLHAAGFEVVIDNGLSTQQSLYFHSLDVKRARPKKPNFTNGSKFSQASQKAGPWTANLTFERDREDRVMLRKLIDATTISVRTLAYGDPFAASGFDELWQADYPNCQVSEDTRDVTTPDTLPETIVVEASRVGSTSIFTDVVNTSYANAAAMA